LEQLTAEKERLSADYDRLKEGLAGLQGKGQRQRAEVERFVENASRDSELVHVLRNQQKWLVGPLERFELEIGGREKTSANDVAQMKRHMKGSVVVSDPENPMIAYPRIHERREELDSLSALISRSYLSNRSLRSGRFFYLVFLHVILDGISFRRF
jgi:hypothetical protein